MSDNKNSKYYRLIAVREDSGVKGVFMAHELFEIEKILAEELIIYRQIYKIEEKKGPVIIEREAGTLTRLTAEQEECLDKITALEKERIRQIEIYSEKHRISSPETLTLEEINKKSGSRASSGIEKTGAQLRKVLEKIKNVQSVNETILRDNIEFYNLMFEELRGHDLTTGAYSSDGKEAVRKGGALLFNSRA